MTDPAGRAQDPGLDQPHDKESQPRRDPADGVHARDAAQVINQRIFETSRDLILVVDRKGNFIRVSPSSAAILGYRAEEMAGRNAIDFIYPDDLDATRAEMRAARRGQIMRNFDCRYVHKEGRVVTLAWTGVWSEPEQQHFFIGRDMTERIEAEERLRLAQRLEAVGQLTGGIAHDFNNLLAVIIGNLDLLALELNAESKARDLLNPALDAALRGAELTRQLLAFARRQSLAPRLTDVNALLAGTAKLLTRTLGENIEIRLALADSLWPVMIDPSQLDSAIMNLAVNARDAMPAGGMLVLATRNASADEIAWSDKDDVAPADYVVLEVTDGGNGIPPEQLGRIFEPFFTTKEAGKGTGLGLAMVYGFVKQSGGHITVYSEVGHGTTFRLYLPRAIAHDGADSANVRDGSVRIGKGEKILVVEDNPAVRAVVVRSLSSLGYAAVEAASGQDALRILAGGGATIDLVFSDIVMPGGISGNDLALQITERWPAIKVLLTSGYPEMVVRNRHQISAEILSKPYRQNDLARKLREILDR